MSEAVDDSLQSAQDSAPGPGSEGSDGRLSAPPPAYAFVERLLREQATSFEFFQAVRLLERLRPLQAPVGGFGQPGAEVVRFGVDPDISFPPSEIRSADLDTDGPARLSVNIMGLTGPLGVLPHVYSLLLAARRQDRDNTAIDFFDVFHHRIISLFYLAWRKYRFTDALESARDDRLDDHVLDLVGVGLGEQRAAAPINERMLAFFSGLLAPGPRSAVALEQMVQEFFGVPARVEQFVGGWYSLPRPEQTEIGREDLPDRLGRGAVAGDEIWDPQARVRIRIGPLDRAQFARFLPTGSAHSELAAIAHFFAHHQFAFEIQLVLERDEVQGVKLGDGPFPLGWSTWIRTRPFDRDADETILTLRTTKGEVL